MKRVKPNPITITISDDEEAPRKNLPRFSDDEDEKVNEVNAVLEQLATSRPA